ncbi:hypothetical protein [Alcaligenes faecalis]|uniref:hypothetical protein n=1 Tax=Alcaligenes faecalis TaxID=511 RepID=UPI0034D7B9CB
MSIKEKALFFWARKSLKNGKNPSNPSTDTIKYSFKMENIKIIEREFFHCEDDHTSIKTTLFLDEDRTIYITVYSSLIFKNSLVRIITRIKNENVIKNIFYTLLSNSIKESTEDTYNLEAYNSDHPNCELHIDYELDDDLYNYIESTQKELDEQLINLIYDYKNYNNIRYFSNYLR